MRTQTLKLNYVIKRLNLKKLEFESLPPEYHFQDEKFCKMKSDFQH